MKANKSFMMVFLLGAMVSTAHGGFSIADVCNMIRGDIEEIRLGKEMAKRELPHTSREKEEIGR